MNVYLSQMFVPSGSQDSQNVLASAGVDHQDEAMVRLLHHYEVKIVPRDDPPLSDLVIAQLGELLNRQFNNLIL